ncbi:uncharacterized protein FPRN_07121 [Fusarium proliferatum]|nr:uncharacterized protein FPRN_07121 [Fusarium proliferatum]
MRSTRKDSASNDWAEISASSKMTLTSRCLSYIRSSSFSTLFRMLGLKKVTFLGSNDPEPPKVLMDSSRSRAIARCAIHIIPAFLSIALITLNCVGFFAGNELQGLKDEDELKLGLLQVAAKLQELLIVASVGSIIFHLIRSELVFGDGMVLGLLVSGFSFSQPSYFWSPEFLGSLGWACGEDVPYGQRWKRCAFILLIFISGALALLAGPATAVLMIPRKIDWPVGGGIYWLNGSDDQLWPRFLDAAYHSEINCTLETGQFTDNRCPSHSFLPMYQHFISWWNGYNTGYGFELNDGWQRKMIYARPALLSDANTWAYSAHAPTAVLQDALRGYHFKALKYLAKKHPNTTPFPRRLDWAKPKRYEVKTKIPATRVYCEPQGIMDLYGQNLTVKFPNLKGLDEYWEDKLDQPDMEIYGAKVLDKVDVLGDVQRALTARGILRDEKSVLNESIFDERREKLIIATDIWDSTKNSLGLVILFKDLFNHTNVTADISPPSNVVACSIDARWAKGKTVMQTTEDYPIYHEYYTGKVLNLIQTELDFPDHMGYVRARPTAPYMEDIRLTPDWYDMLSPTLPDKSPDHLPWMPIHGSKRTTLETLLISVYNQDFRQTELENLIATVFVDGLSRSGLIPNYNASRFLEAWSFGDFGVENDELARKLLHKGDPKEIFPEPAILKSGKSKRMEMRAIYNGYVMTAKDWFDYLCMFCLALHAAIALIHTIFVAFIKHKTGEAWDSILELIALTQRSTPPERPLLSNTSAGVKSLRTVKLIAWVEAPETRETTALEDKKFPGGELQMKFSDSSQRREEELKPVADKPPAAPSAITYILSFSPNKLAIIHYIEPSGWGKGNILRTGYRGWIPSNYYLIYNPEPIKPLLQTMIPFSDAANAMEAKLCATKQGNSQVFESLSNVLIRTILILYHSSQLIVHLKALEHSLRSINLSMYTAEGLQTLRLSLLKRVSLLDQYINNTKSFVSHQPEDGSDPATTSATELQTKKLA